jgi:hypothetical protein
MVLRLARGGVELGGAGRVLLECLYCSEPAVSSSFPGWESVEVSSGSLLLLVTSTTVLGQKFEYCIAPTEVTKYRVLKVLTRCRREALTSPQSSKTSNAIIMLYPSKGYAR